MLSRSILCPFALLLGAASPVAAQTGSVAGLQKISDTAGGFSGDLDPGGRFALTVASIGDLDGDGVADLVVGKEADDDGGPNRGAVYVLFLEPGGTVRAHQKISATAGGFGGTLADQVRFGAAVAPLGDLDGDGRLELAVGTIWDAGAGGLKRGAVWVLSLEADGTVFAQHRITEGQAGFVGPLGDDDWFGVSLAPLGDLDGAGPAVTALAVGALRHDDGGSDRGAVWVLFLDGSGAVIGEQKLSATAGGFGGSLGDGDRFGRKVCHLGDLDGDGAPELAVGAPGNDDGGLDRGAVWILSLASDGTATAWREIADGLGGFGGALGDEDFFGRGLGTPGDLDCDGVQDLVVGATRDDDGGADRGAVWLLFLNADGSVRESAKISELAGSFTGGLDDLDVFGTAAVGVGDLDGDGVGDLAVGAPGDDDGGENHGALWLLFLEREGSGLGTPYCCPSVPNSSGSSVQLVASGSPVVADGDLTLSTSGLPPDRIGMYIAARETAWVPQAGGSQGVLCLGGPIARLAGTAASSGPAGQIQASIDLASLGVLGAVQAGETWSFQLWYRDALGGQSTSNFSDAVSIDFQ